jgi:dolichol-phosphate mannosyltransferase
MTPTAGRQLLSIVVPVYNEGEQLAHTLPVIAEAARATGLATEIVLVDDGSRDDTWAVCGEICGSVAGVRGVRLTRNFGKEAAILCGLAEARGDAVVVMDSDLQHPPALMAQMVERWREGCAIVEATKTRRGDEATLRGWLSRQFYRVMRFLSGVELAGATDYKLLDRRVVDAYLQMSEANRFFRGLIEWTGFTKASLPFEVPSTEVRRSRWSFTKLVRYSVAAITAFSDVPLRLTTLTGFATLCASVVLIAYTFLMWLSGHAVEGFTTVIILILSMGSALLICLGIIGEYLARIYEEVKRRPAFFVSQRHDGAAAGLAVSNRRTAESGH